MRVVCIVFVALLFSGGSIVPRMCQCVLCVALLCVFLSDFFFALDVSLLLEICAIYCIVFEFNIM